jgi:DNA-directed RNA polymerase subunit RPC12/RpoP
MAVKYFCDDCGEELGNWDNIAYQLDNTGHVYCHKCVNKHANVEKPYSWSSVDAKEKIERWKFLKQQVKE